MILVFAERLAQHAHHQQGQRARALAFIARSLEL
jgi:hypothetical protein